MKMKTHTVTQRSNEWHALRSSHFCASDAPAMLGISQYETRADLMTRIKYGVQKEHDSATIARFNLGHENEKKALPIAAEIIGEELFSPTGTRGKLLASFDGLTMDDSVAFEHKTLNNDIRNCISSSDLPEHYRAQMEQQLYVSGAEKCLFLATKWDRDTLLDKVYFWYYPDEKLRARIVDGWAQFERDLETFTYKEPQKKHIAEPIEALPTLRISVSGMVSESNLREFEALAMQRIAAINETLETDEDFAEAKQAVSWFKDLENAIEEAKRLALSSMTSVNDVFNALDSIFERSRTKRLSLDNLVKTREKSIKIEKIEAAKKQLIAHVEELNTELAPAKLTVSTDYFAPAIKNLRTLSSIDNALAAELLRAKSEASEQARLIRKNINELDKLAGGYKFLFTDSSILFKQPDDFNALVIARISDYERQQQEKRAKEEEAPAISAVKQLDASDWPIIRSENARPKQALASRDELAKMLGFAFNKTLLDVLMVPMQHGLYDANAAFDALIEHIKRVKSKI